MSRPDAGSEPSMDDILASIRRIIADDSPDDGVQPPDPMPGLQSAEPQGGMPAEFDPATQSIVTPHTGTAPLVGDGLMPQSADDDDDILDLVEETPPEPPHDNAHFSPAAQPAEPASLWDAGAQSAHDSDTTSESAEGPSLDDGPSSNGYAQETLGTPTDDWRDTDVQEAGPSLDAPEPDAADVAQTSPEDHEITPSEPETHWEPSSLQSDLASPPDALAAEPADQDALSPTPSPMSTEPTPLPFEFRSVEDQDSGPVAPSTLGTDRLSGILAANPDAADTESEGADPVSTDAPQPPDTEQPDIAAEPPTFPSAFAEEETEPGPSFGSPSLADQDVFASGPEVLATMAPSLTQPDDTHDDLTDVHDGGDLAPGFDTPADGDTFAQASDSGPAYDDGAEFSVSSSEDHDTIIPSPDAGPAALDAASFGAAAGAAASLVAQNSETSSDETDPTAAPGRTLEAVVTDAMRPLLQEWIDKNMPEVAEKLLRELATADRSGEKNED